MIRTRRWILAAASAVALAQSAAVASAAAQGLGTAPAARTSAVTASGVQAQADPSDRLFPLLHRCYREPAAPSCWVLRGLMQPNWSLAQDLVVLPHRGYWGFDEVADFPENSKPGYLEVSPAGYDYSEVDFMPSADGVVMSHDYVLPRLTQAPPDDAQLIYDLPSAYVTSLQQRDRFGVIHPDLHVLSAQNTFEYFKAGATPYTPPPVIFADIKQRPNADPDLYAKNWVKTLSAILELAPEDQLYQLVVKTPYAPVFIIRNLSAKARGKFLEVLWMPQAASDGYYKNNPPGMGGDPVANSADFVDLWKQSGAVLAYETNYKGPDDSRLKPFTRGGVEYANILDYIKQTTGRRGGVFAEEPVGLRGVVNRMARWEVKDADDDMRGDFVFEAVAPKWGNFIIVTTDRPDVWRSVRSRVWPSDASARRTPARPVSPSTRLPGATR